MAAKLVSAKLIELAKRLVTYNESLGIYANGTDNAYPERVERHINNSATAKPCAKLLRKFIIGQGVDGLNKKIVHEDDQITLRQFLKDLANSYAYHNGVFIHVNYNLACEIISMKVLPYNHCRIGKKDDKKYNGKILLYDDWNGKIDKTKIEPIDVFNPRKAVITDQIKKAGEVSKYKGQIFFLNPDDTIYPLAHIDNVMNDADSEFRVGQFKNLSLRKGFFGKKLVITPPMVDGDVSGDITKEQAEEKRLAEKERDNFREQMQDFVGSDNVDGILHLEMEFDDDQKFEDVLRFVDIEANIDDKLFAHTEKSVANNIRKAYANIPSILIESNDSSVFGQSGALLTAAKVFYQDQTEEDRQMIEEDVLNILLKRFKGIEIPDEGVKIKKLINETDKPDRHTAE